MAELALAEGKNGWVELSAEAAGERGVWRRNEGVTPEDMTVLPCRNEASGPTERLEGRKKGREKKEQRRG